MSVGAVRESGPHLPIPSPPAAPWAPLSTFSKGSPPSVPAGDARTQSPPDELDPIRGSSSAFAVVLDRLGRQVEHGERLVRSALGAAGRAEAIAPADLIALQAGVYRYSEAVDLASRLVDRAAGAVKTVLQGQ